MNNTKRIHAGTDRTRANDATLRRRLMLSASVLVASVGGYARSAQADCNPQGGGTYLCTGATVTPQVFFYGGDVTVTTDPTFSANVAGGDALRFVGDGTMSFEDLNASSIVATTSNGIYLANGGAGGTTITTTGMSPRETSVSARSTSSAVTSRSTRKARSTSHTGLAGTRSMAVAPSASHRTATLRLSTGPLEA